MTINPKLHYRVQCKSFLELNENKVIHLKSTPYKKEYRHWYWSFTMGNLIGGSGLIMPVPSVALPSPCLENAELLDRSEVQLGDSVQYFNESGLMFGTIVGQEKPGIWLILGNDGNTCSINCKNYSDTGELLLVDHNLGQRPRASTNVAGAQTMQELEFAEGIGAALALDVVLDILQRADLTMGKKTFLWCHRAMFELCYDWAGVLRDHEMVVKVGNKEHPTESPLNLPSELDAFFKEFATPLLRQSINRKKLITALVHAHARLAWIHPFHDGNGRAIRLFLELVALKWGYRLEWGWVLARPSSKRYYHYCVGLAVRHKIQRLTMMFEKILVSI